MDLLKNLVLSAALVATVIPASAEDFYFRLGDATFGELQDIDPPPGGTPVEELSERYRVDITDFDGSAGTLAEAYIESGTKRLTPYYASLADNTISGSEAIFDDKASTIWTGASGVRTATLFFEIPYDSHADALRFIGGGAAAPRNFTILKKVGDFDAWSPVVTYDGETAWTQGEDRRYPFDPVPTEVAGNEHRYWRVRTVKTLNDSPPFIAELSFLDASGTRVFGGTPIASQGAPANAFDGGQYSAWEATSGTGAGWLGYDFVTPVAIKDVSITAYLTSRAPEKFVIEHSDDARAWKSDANYLGQGEWEKFPNNGTRTYPVVKPTYGPTYHQFWRMVVEEQPTAPAKPYGVSILELKATEASDPNPASGNVMWGGVGSTSSDLSAPNGKSNLWDGTYYNNSWRPAESDVLPTVAYTFPRPVAIDAFHMAGAKDGSERVGGPRAFSIESSDDGTTWKKAVSYAGQGDWEPYAYRALPIVKPARVAGTHQYWRMETADDTALTGRSSIYIINELEMRDASGKDLTQRGVLSYSSDQQPHYDGSSLFDGNNSGNGWRPASKTAYYGYVFPAPVRPATIAILSNDGGPSNFTLKSSDDGSVWKTEGKFDGIGGYRQGTFETVEVAPPADPSPGEYQYLRARFEESNRTTSMTIGTTISEFYPLDASGTNLAGNGVAIGSNHNSSTSWTPDAAFNQGFYTVWNPTATQSDLGYIFRKPVPVASVRLDVWQGYGRGPQAFSFEGSNDGESWTRLSKYVGQGTDLWGEVGTATYPLVQPAKNANEHSWWRVKFLAAGSGDSVDLAGIKGYDKQGAQVMLRGVPYSGAGFDPADGQAANGWDNNQYSYWTTPGLPSALSYINPKPVSLGKIVITENANNHDVRDFDVESSDDGIAWTKEAEYRDAGGWPDEPSQEFPVPNVPEEALPPEQSLEYRIAIQQSGGTDPTRSATVSEITLLKNATVGGDGTVSGTRVPITGSITGQTTVSGTPNLAFDGGQYTSWVGSGPKMSLGVAFAKGSVIENFNYIGSTQCECLQKVTLEKRDAGASSWTFVASKTFDTRPVAVSSLAMSPATANIVDGSGTPAAVTYRVANNGKADSGAVTPSLTATDLFAISGGTCGTGTVPSGGDCTVEVSRTAVPSVEPKWSASLKVAFANGGQGASTVTGSVPGVAPTCSTSMANGTQCTIDDVPAEVIDEIIVAICDEGMVWNGTSCTGTRSQFFWATNRFNGTSKSGNDGMANTTAAIAENEGPQAALACRSKGPAWYLPATTQLRRVMDASIGTSADTFDRSGWYWSSLQYGASMAYVMQPKTSYRSSFGEKNSSQLPVRCARS